MSTAEDVIEFRGYVDQLKVDYMEAIAFAAKKLFWNATLFLGVITTSFLLFYLVPGDTARVMLGPTASEESVSLLRSSLGLDKPIFEQLWRQYDRVLHLDLGKSIISSSDVSRELAQKFPLTILVGVLASLFALLLSYSLNLLGFFFPRTILLTKIMKLFVMIPMFLSGVVAAIVLGIWFKLVSLSGITLNEAFPAILLPALIVSLYPLALMTEILSDKVTKGAGSSWVIAYAARGYSRLRIFHSAILKPAAIPWLSVLTNQISLIFLSSFVLEIIFTIDGVGPLLLRSIQQKDFPIMHGIIVANCFLFVLISYLSEIFYRIIDPRLKFGASS